MLVAASMGMPSVVQDMLEHYPEHLQDNLDPDQWVHLLGRVSPATRRKAIGWPENTPHLQRGEGAKFARRPKSRSAAAVIIVFYSPVEKRMMKVAVPRFCSPIPMSDPDITSPTVFGDNPSSGEPGARTWEEHLKVRCQQGGHQPTSRELQKLLRKGTKLTAGELKNWLQFCPNPDLSLVEATLQHPDKVAALAKNTLLDRVERNAIGRWAAQALGRPGSWSQAHQRVFDLLARQVPGLPEGAKRQLIQSCQGRAGNLPNVSFRQTIQEVAHQFSPRQLLSVLEAHPKWWSMAEKLAQHPDVQPQHLERLPKLGAGDGGTFRLLDLATRTPVSLRSQQLRERMDREEGKIRLRLLAYYKGEEAGQITRELIASYKQKLGNQSRAEKKVAQYVVELPFAYKHQLSREGLLPLLQSSNPQARNLIIRELGHLMADPPENPAPQRHR